MKLLKTCPPLVSPLCFEFLARNESAFDGIIKESPVDCHRRVTRNSSFRDQMDALSSSGSK